MCTVPGTFACVCSTLLGHPSRQLQNLCGYALTSLLLYPSSPMWSNSHLFVSFFSLPNLPLNIYTAVDTAPSPSPACTEQCRLHSSLFLSQVLHMPKRPVKVHIWLERLPLIHLLKEVRNTHMIICVLVHQICLFFSILIYSFYLECDNFSNCSVAVCVLLTCPHSWTTMTIADQPLPPPANNNEYQKQTSWSSFFCCIFFLRYSIY